MNTILITGGSSGIGYEMSRHFAQAGYRLLWVSKPEAELRESKARLVDSQPGVEIHTLALDLTIPTAAATVWEWTQENKWTVDVLINNAGIGAYGYVAEIPEEKEMTMIELNVLNVYRLTRIFLKAMRKRDAGTIINISSNSSFQPVPRLTTYASTKAFITHFTRGLHEEMKLMKSNVRIMCVCPAAIVDTAFKAAASMEGVKTFKGLAYTTAEEVAADVWQGFQRGKSFVVSGQKMRWLYAIRNLVPWRLEQYLVQKETERE